jgi:murein L,D-transpeptidase YcbB/YkuD
MAQEGENIRRQVPLEVVISEDRQAGENSRNREALMEVTAMRANQKYSQAVEAAEAGRFAEAQQLASEAKVYLASEAAAQDSEQLSIQARAMEVRARQLSAMQAAPAPAQQNYIKSAKASLYKASSGNSSQMLKEGAKGLEVELLQAELSRRGYYKGATDGLYGPELREAVRRFQTDNNLTPDGMAGPETQAALGM